MRSSKWLPLVVVLVATLFSATEAAALGCWVCENSYDTCLYYRSQERLSCRQGCATMYPQGGAPYTACINTCQAEYGAGVLECYNQREWCYENCGPIEKPPIDNCPVVVDLGKNNWDFTSAAEGVLFDIDGTGTAKFIAWTAASSDDGFLVLDRNQNGTIDSGRELFGDATAQAPSETRNGFLALAAFDDNQDGIISSIDGVFAALRIWVDRNHNGASEADELTSLADNKIVAIDLDYKESRRQDRNGNELRYRTRVQLESGHTDAIDVFFKENK
jgi:hypothetical protein